MHNTLLCRPRAPQLHCTLYANTEQPNFAELCGIQRTTDLSFRVYYTVYIVCCTLYSVHCMLYTVQPTSSALYLYDIITLYARLVERARDLGLNPGSGTVLFDLSRGTSFYGTCMPALRRSALNVEMRRMRRSAFIAGVRLLGRICGVYFK